MEYSYNIFFLMSLSANSNIYVSSQSNDWLFSYFWVVFYCFFACLIIFHWLSKIEFYLVGFWMFSYFYYSLALFWHVVVWIQSDTFRSCFYFSFGRLEAEFSLGLITPNYWGKAFLSILLNAPYYECFQSDWLK